MKQTLLTALMIGMIAFIGQAQDYKTLIQKADSLRKAKEYSSSLKMYEQGFKLEQKNKVHLYNAACSAALAGKKKKAFSLLESSVENGYTRLSHLQQDPDLKSLRGEPQWQELVNQVQKKADALEKELDKPLQAQLLQIHQTDQQYRKQMDSVQKSYGTNSTQMQELQQKTRKQDSINLAKVKAILDQHGWVGPRKVGLEASNTLFLVIQHNDQATQEKYLPMMREAVKKGDAQASSLALLEDRVADGQGKKQIYGSQLGIDPATGKPYLLPLEDPDHVDQRRAAVGLPPLAEYLQHFGLTWNVEEYKKQQGKIKKNNH